MRGGFVFVIKLLKYKGAYGIIWQKKNFAVFCGQTEKEICYRSKI